MTEELAMLVFQCPKCGLLMSETKPREHPDGWTHLLCWRCDHQFGVVADRGTFDLGVERVVEGRNDYRMFFENFEGLTQLETPVRPQPEEGS